MRIKNYAIGTFIGSLPSMFVTVSLGSGIEQVIDKNVEINFYKVITSPEIFLPILGFVTILLFALVIKKIFFK